MNVHPAYHKLLNKHYRQNVILFSVFGLTLMTVGMDFLYSSLQKTSFFISESILFSSFWLLFFPLLNIQFIISKRIRSIYAGFFIPVGMIAIHLLIYPFIVWFFSALFYSHAFEYMQTLRFSITEYFIKLILIYVLPIPVMFFYKNNCSTISAIPKKAEPHSTQYPTTLVVSDAYNRKIVLDIKEIFYFSANSPYIDIHHPTKKYLFTGTLKSLEPGLQALGFIRIHRSCIANLSKVDSYTSRKNGDYDLLLLDSTKLRVSRIYAAAFIAALKNVPRLRGI